MNVICVHGWALGPGIWSRMNDRLVALMEEIQISITVADLGFYGPPQLPAGHFDLGIGHSLGALWLLDHPQVSWDRLVIINGFTRFTRCDDFPLGWPPRMIQRMNRQLGVDPNRVVGDFLDKAGVNPDSVGAPRQRESKDVQLDVERLKWGLDFLRNRDGREQWSLNPGSKRALASTKDPIVSVEHTQACFESSDIQWLDSKSHCLPLQFPEICAALVRELIETS